MKTAEKQSTPRLRSAGAVIKDTSNVVKNKLINDTLEAGRLVDTGITQLKNITSTRKMGLEMAGIGEIGKVHTTPKNTHVVENKLKDMLSRIDGVNISSASSKGTANAVHKVEVDEVIRNDYDKDGNLINRSIVPKGYDSVEDFLKIVDDTTIKEYGYDSIEEFKTVVGLVDNYLNESPKNNIVNKGLAGGTHVKGVNYDVLGFPIFKGEDVKFALKLKESLFKASDDTQFKECTKMLKEAIEIGDVSKDIFTTKQLRDIDNGEARIKGLTWHHHQVPGKMQLVVTKTHKVNHLGGNKLWGDGIR